MGIIRPEGVTEADAAYRALVGLEKAKERRVAEVRAAADERIAELFGKEPRSFDVVAQQLNASKQALRRLLAMVETLSDGGTPTAQERSDATSMLNLADQIDAIRTASNAAQDAIQALTTIEDVDGFSYSLP